MTIPLCSSLSRSLLLAAALLSFASTGCDTGPLFVGQWECDRTGIMGNPNAAENDTHDFFAPVPKFQMQLTKDGKCNITYQENGADKTKAGTWRMVKDETLKWELAIMPGPEEQEEQLKVGSPSNRSLSMELIGFAKGGPLYFQRKSY